jgi:hypothetical protein
VAALQADGRVSAEVVLGPGPDQRLVYAVSSDPGADAIGLRYEPGRLTIVLPLAMATAWTHSEAAALEARLPVHAASDLKVVIEKDFACRTPRDAAEDAGAFPNPLPGHVC